MSSPATIEALAKEFSIQPAEAQRLCELLAAGFKVPFLAHYRRADTGALAEGTLRRFTRRLRRFEELEKRKATLLQSLEEQAKARPGEEALDPKERARIEDCRDRLELEDLFLPHRRPEPEVLQALDRGLGALADLLVTSESKEGGEKKGEAKETAPQAGPEDTDAVVVDAAVTPEPEPSDAAAEGEAASEEEGVGADATPPAEADSVPDSGSQESAAASDEKPAEAGASGDGEPTSPAPGKTAPAVDLPTVHGLHVEITPDLARACAAFVNPDRGVHTDKDALEGAVRILSDRLGRDPELRGLLRRMLRKHGRLKVRALVPEKELGRNRSLLKIDGPIKQVQGHRLLALRQAQSQRQVAVGITIDESLVFPKVRAALGRNIPKGFAKLADAIAQQALRQRLLPMIEEGVRMELKERADEEAIGFLAQHLRQILLTPPAGRRPCAGVHADAKGDWLIWVVDENGDPVGSEIRIEAGSAEVRDLADPLGNALRESGVRSLAMSHAKSARPSVQKLRETIQLLGGDACVYLVNDAGLAGYANSEAARRELADHSVPARQAIGLARRYQDPLREFLKTDLRHLGLGREQAVISKANLRRLLHDAVESAVAHVGCDLNEAPLSFLRHVPGLGFELASKLVERRAERPFASRAELRDESLLDDAAWTNAIGFLRIKGSSEPLDATAIHPEQYDLVRRMIHEAGHSVEEALGHRDGLRGVDRKAFDLDEYTWRDLQREISFPGRDPRPRLFFPHLLPPDTDPKTLEKDTVVEAIVTNVTSFGAFVDLGLGKDAMVHVSEISSRYVRDARGLLSVGQVVRARVLNSAGPRVELSLKNVPDSRRRGGGGGPKRGRGRRGKEGEEAWPEHEPLRRAARSRRDGLVGGAPKRDRKGGGPPTRWTGRPQEARRPPGTRRGLRSRRDPGGGQGRLGLQPLRELLQGEGRERGVSPRYSSKSMRID